MLMWVKGMSVCDQFQNMFLENLQSNQINRRLTTPTNEDQSGNTTLAIEKPNTKTTSADNNSAKQLNTRH